MIQYGDITKLSGYDLDPVDLIVGGSPCQDLSVAGQRKGLDGDRSGLFMEMIRIIKEMREKTNGNNPRYALWENVPGAFSSNGGKDFSVVLGEFARLIEPSAPDVPVPKDRLPESGVLLVSEGGGHCLQNSRCAILGSAPTKKENLTCRQFWSSARLENTF